MAGKVFRYETLIGLNLLSGTKSLNKFLTKSTPVCPETLPVTVGEGATKRSAKGWKLINVWSREEGDLDFVAVTASTTSHLSSRSIPNSCRSLAANLLREVSARDHTQA